MAEAVIKSRVFSFWKISTPFFKAIGIPICHQLVYQRGWKCVSASKDSDFFIWHASLFKFFKELEIWAASIFSSENFLYKFFRLFHLPIQVPSGAFEQNGLPVNLMRLQARGLNGNSV